MTDLDWDAIEEACADKAKAAKTTGHSEDLAFACRPCIEAAFEARVDEARCGALVEAAEEVSRQLPELHHARKSCVHAILALADAPAQLKEQP